MSSRGVVAAILLILLSGAAHADIATKAGTRGAQFLRIAPGGRNTALGGSYAVLGSDGFSLWGQPAAAANAEKMTISLQHNEYFQGLSQEFIGAIYPVGDKSGVAVTLNYLDAGDLDRTIENTAGQFVSQTGTFGATDNAFGLYYGMEITSSLAVGLGGKYILSRIDGVEATAFAVDAGLTYRISDKFNLGASIVNVGSELQFITKREELPMTYRLGGSYLWDLTRNRSVLFTGDAWGGPDIDWEFGGGVEAKLLPHVSLRGGYNTVATDITSGLSAGLGFDLSIGGVDLDLDYSYVPFDDLGGDAHRGSINLKWGK